MVKRKTVFLTDLSLCEHNHKQAQSKLSAQSAQFAVRMRKHRHLGHRYGNTIGTNLIRALPDLSRDNLIE